MCVFEKSFKGFNYWMAPRFLSCTGNVEMLHKNSHTAFDGECVCVAIVSCGATFDLIPFNTFQFLNCFAHTSTNQQVHHHHRVIGRDLSLSWYSIFQRGIRWL